MAKVHVDIAFLNCSLVWNAIEGNVFVRPFAVDRVASDMCMFVGFCVAAVYSGERA